jgi:hypothetical protein
MLCWSEFVLRLILSVHKVPDEGYSRNGKIHESVENQQKYNKSVLYQEIDTKLTYITENISHVS